MSDVANLAKQSYQAKVFTELLATRPDTPILDRVASPADLKGLSSDELIALADELRAYLLYSTGVSGGHFGANLGVVELTIALHTVLNTPYDKLVWDVGHQAYAHKVLTGRRDRLPSIRSKDGLTAFPERSESEYDTFGVGHSSTSISAALGMSLAARLLGENRKVAAVIGDGAMTGGMAFEAMNDAVQQNADLLVVLNDNDMSISAAIGGFSRHLAKLWQRGLAMDIDKHGNILMVKRDISSDDRRIRHYLQMANGAFEDVSSRLPSKISEKITGLLSGISSSPLPDKIAEKIGDKLFADNLFKAIGFTYLGPFDGHDLPKLVSVLERASKLKGAVLVHVHTVKGKGFLPAEADPIGYHAIGKLPKAASGDAAKPTTAPAKKYSQIFGDWLMQTAQDDANLVAITPAMAEGSGMVEYAHKFPERFFDVAIAEQHAVTLAAGMATSGKLKPVVAIYSTFLQRGYDQLIHDVALQNLDVTFAIDRAGLVGEDGATHAGVFDLAYLRCVPNVIIAAPSDEHECHHLLNACYRYQGTAAVRYPRGAGIGRAIDTSVDAFVIGKANHVWSSDNFATAQGDKLAVLAFGTRLADALAAAKKLSDDTGMAMSVIDMRWVKPLDTELLDALIAQGVSHIATVEEHQIAGGAGSAVNEYLLAHNADVKIQNLGIADRFIEHASHEQQLAACGLDKDGVYQSLSNWLNA
ncbi:1-deoxy-D-xylulose-5-phosphate synthase [Moraxella sp. FZLJ2107]|uniref:1-deoxy-D-xylulose-5-phosphate synthase n=1 Tax=unclassified Moraxella TaxID=2685852 RepID=UPI0020C83A35|nr:MULTISPECIES: 1-deoxy-D-xylulose-5-phosphate synthase [unclassified Moraxella]UTO06092.1 1-deoxy-D-xylulose-5-phosphate synthase [Moraxella sp. FZLJ2107]UTO22829.1 1-deoxy-D-xylulose-5-phosphate synthase [Moraxella sp. FZLJ2109]